MKASEAQNYIHILNSDIPAWEFWLLAALFVAVVVFGISYFSVKIIKNIRSMKEVVNSLINKPPHDYKPQVYKEVDISKLLRMIKQQTKSDRALIIQYHNGEKSIANNPFLKFTCTHESLSETAPSVQRHIMGVPINLCGNWNTQLFNGENVCYPDIEDMNKEPEQRGLYQFITSLGTRSIYAFPLTDATGRTYGVGIVEYMRQPHNLEKKCIRWAHNRFHAIGVLLAGTKDEEVD